MFARSLLIQFPFFIHKRRVAAVGAKFPFSLARPPSRSSKRLPLCIYITVRAVRVFFHPLCTHREDKMCMHPPVDQPTNPRSLIQFSNLPYLFFHKTFEKIFCEFSLLRTARISNSRTKRATAAETIRNLAVPAAGVIPNQTYMTLHFG
jgi:hypothetical protein